MEEEQYKRPKRPNKHLRRERELRGWSQQFLAEKLGSTEFIVSHWETGSHKPNRYFQTQLCQLFGKNAEELGFMDVSEVAELEKKPPCITRLRETMHYLGKSVEMVAAEVGVGTRTLYSYVSGKVVVPDELRAPLAKALGTTQDYLFPHPSQWLLAPVKDNRPLSPAYDGGQPSSVSLKHLSPDLSPSYIDTDRSERLDLGQQQREMPLQPIEAQLQEQEGQIFPERIIVYWQSEVAPAFAAWWTPIREHQEALTTLQEMSYGSLEVELLALALRWKDSSDSIMFLQQSAYTSIRKHDAMNNENMTRRRALEAIALFPIQVYGLSQTPFGTRSLPLKELLATCATGITACWELRRSQPDGLPIVQRLLSAYLPTLEQAARQSSPSQSSAAYLASQGYLLLGVLADHYGKLDYMEAASQQARFYGQLAQDVNLEVAALTRLAVAYDYKGNYVKGLETYQEAAALPGFSGVSPLLQGRVYAGLASTNAYCSQPTQALSYLSRAKEVYPDDPGVDPSYQFALCGNTTLALWEGLTLKHTEDYSASFGVFTRFGTLTPTSGVLEQNRADHLNYAASVAVRQKDLDAALLYLDAAEGIAQDIQHAMRLSEVHDTLRSMRLLWPHEAKVKTLQEKFYQY